MPSKYFFNLCIIIGILVEKFTTILGEIKTKKNFNNVKYSGNMNGKKEVRALSMAV